MRKTGSVKAHDSSNLAAASLFWQSAEQHAHILHSFVDQNYCFTCNAAVANNTARAEALGMSVSFLKLNNPYNLQAPFPLESVMES